MADAPTLTLSFVAGAALGVTFFGGLWWTVRRGVSSELPGLWFLLSRLLRTGALLMGFYVVSGHRWERMLACLVGFTLARPAVTYLARQSPPGRAQEARDAPQP